MIAAAPARTAIIGIPAARCRLEGIYDKVEVTARSFACVLYKLSLVISSHQPQTDQRVGFAGWHTDAPINVLNLSRWWDRLSSRLR
jgi:hypothetical protein